MKPARLFGTALIVLLLALIALPLLARFDLLPFGPSEAEYHELDERWTALVAKVEPAVPSANAELAELNERLGSFETAFEPLALPIDRLDPAEREFLGDLLRWWDTVPVDSLGGGDGLPAVRVVGYALSIEPPLDLPLAKLLDAADRIQSRANLLHALASHLLENKLLRRAGELELERSSLGSPRRPTSVDLARSLVVDAMGVVRFVEETMRPSDTSEGGTLQAGADRFYEYAVRAAVVDYGERVWAARESLDQLALIEPTEAPGQAALYFASIFRQPRAISANTEALLSTRLATTVDHWRRLGEEWDEALAALPND